MPINKNELTKEQIEKAMQCKTADDLMAYAKSEGIDITREEAEAYFAELADVELDGDVLKSVAGGHDYLPAVMITFAGTALRISIVLKTNSD